jgi:hypothetical protein
MFPYERFFGFLKSLVHNWLFSKVSIVRGYKTIEVVEWAMGYIDPQNLFGVLAHGMKVGFLVLGPWGNSQSLWNQMLSKRLISP